MILAHKICLDPTCKQRSQLAKAAGCARYAWNWALERCEKHYAETGKLADLNASINLRTLGLRGNHACGHQSSDGIAVKPRWSKQELTPCSLVNTI
jgi:transposase